MSLLIAIRKIRLYMSWNRGFIESVRILRGKAK